MLRKRFRRGSQECRAGNVSSDGNDKQCARGFAARLPRRGDVSLHCYGGKKQNGKESAADHPPGGNSRKNQVSGSEGLIQPKITHCLDNAGKDKSKSQDQRGSVVCAPETH